MPRKSIKPNKSIYFLSREEAGLTRAEASEKSLIPESRIEKIEYGQTMINPQDVVAMAAAYKKPSLCNYFCANDCEIGRGTVTELKVEHLAQIVLSIVNSLNTLNSERDRLIQIAADGEVNSDELADFISIRKKLGEIADTVNSLQLWIDQMMADGKISREEYEAHLNQK